MILGLMMGGKVPEQDPTPESIAAAKAFNASERAKAERELGLVIKPDGTVAEIRPVDVVALDAYGLTEPDRECSDRMSALVEQFSWITVERCFRLEAAANGFMVRVLAENEAGR